MTPDSTNSLEFKKARSYCYARSKFDPKLQEKIFIGSPEEIVDFVNIALGPNVLPEMIPDLPQGLVLDDNRCRGAFQVLDQKN